MATGFVQRFKGKIAVKSPLFMDGLALFSSNPGTPVNGGAGTGAGVVDPGAILLDTTNKALYQNTGTRASPISKQPIRQHQNIIFQIFLLTQIGWISNL